MMGNNDLAFLEAWNGRFPDHSLQIRPDDVPGQHADQDETRHADGQPHRRDPQRGFPFIGDAGQD